MTTSPTIFVVLATLGLTAGCASDPLTMLPPLERSLIQSDARSRTAANSSGAVSVEHMLDSIRQQYGTDERQQPAADKNDG